MPFVEPNMGALCLDEAAADLLGRRVSAWLAMHRVRPQELAQALGVPYYQLSKCLHGRRAFPVAEAEKICAWTGMRLQGLTVVYDAAKARDHLAPPDPRLSRIQNHPVPS